MAVTPILFAEALLTRLGAPVTPSNIAALVAWQATEGGHMNHAVYNPMNTTQPMPGAVNAGLQNPYIKAYSSWKEGIEATARTLEGPIAFGYGPILAALKRSAPPDETLKAVAASKWGCSICANAPASSKQYYGQLIFPGVGTLDFTKFKMDGVTIAVLAGIVGGGLLAYTLWKRR